MMKIALRFDKRFNEAVLIENRLNVVSRDGLNVIVSGTFYDAIQLKNYPFIKDMSIVKL